MSLLPTLARLAPLAAVVALAGCAPSAQTAAVVNGETVTTAQVNALIEGCAELQATVPTALTVLAQEKFFHHLAAANQVSFTDPEIDAAIKDVGYGELLASQPGCRPALVGEAAQLIMGRTVDQAAFDAALQDFDVQVNPRYGEWDPEQLAVSGSGSLSVPADQG